ncbi:hypothetical protein AAMO2058_000852300 [Amorphochlora amoebiformis]
MPSLAGLAVLVGLGFHSVEGSPTYGKNRGSVCGLNRIRTPRRFIQRRRAGEDSDDWYGFLKKQSNKEGGGEKSRGEGGGETPEDERRRLYGMDPVPVNDPNFKVDNPFRKLSPQELLKSKEDRESEIDQMADDYEKDFKDFDWTQTDTEVNVYIPIYDPSITPMDIEIVQKSRNKLDIRVFDQPLTQSPLALEVIPDSTYWFLDELEGKRCIHIVLEKRDKDRIWPYLFLEEDIEPTLEITDRVYMDIDIDGDRIGRIVIGVFGEDVPKTSKNFLALSEGSSGTFKGRNMHYKGTRFHKIIPNFILQAGDFANGDGSGKGSIFGPTFKDENFRIRHMEAGVVTMANAGRDSNGAQFMITLQPSSWLDMKHVAFGKVIEGMDVVQKIAKMGSSTGEPLGEVLIADCGILPFFSA